MPRYKPGRAQTESWNHRERRREEHSARPKYQPPPEQSDGADLTPDTSFECRCGRKFLAIRETATGGVFMPVEYAMVLTTGFESVSAALKATRCRPCVREKGLLAKARPLSNILREFALNGLDWPGLPETEEFLAACEEYKRRATQVRLERLKRKLKATLEEEEEFEILNDLFAPFDDSQGELAARTADLGEESDGLDMLLHVVDIDVLERSLADPIFELRQPEPIALRAPDTSDLEPIEQLHTNGAHVVGGMPEPPPVEEQTDEFPLIPIELDA